MASTIKIAVYLYMHTYMRGIRNFEAGLCSYDCPSTIHMHIHVRIHLHVHMHVYVHVHVHEEVHIHVHVPTHLPRLPHVIQKHQYVYTLMNMFIYALTYLSACFSVYDCAYIYAPAHLRK